MSSNVTKCPACGHMSEDPEWCDNCGAPLDEATQEDQDNEWYDSGDVLEVRCDLSTVDALPEACEAILRLELVEVIEASSVRHISRARLLEVVEAQGDADAEAIHAALELQQFTLEELGELLGSRDEELPDEVAHLVRLPIGALEHGAHQVRLFMRDGSRTLEEYVIANQGRLDLQEIKYVFTALLDLAEELHEHDYLYLRLSPWTLRVLRNEEFEHTSLGDEETFSEDDAEDAPAEDGAPEAEQGEATIEDLGALGNTRGEDGGDEAAQEDPDEGEEDRDLDDTDVLDTSPGFQSLDYDLEEVSHPHSSTRPRVALLDGGFRFYRPRESYEEVPVVVGFSPPEMFGRTRADIGTHCDIFSLGMLLYYLIAGELPPTSVYTRHTPALPARHFRPDFPIGFQTVISRATRPDPAERFADVAAMRASFERACELIEQRIQTMREANAPRIDFAVERHIGIAKRLRNPVNQDNVFGQRSEDGRFALLVVADGVSTASYGSGDLASEQIVAVANERWEEISGRYLIGEPIDEFEIIYELLDEANKRIVAHVNANHLPFHGNPHEVMGTTALVAVIHNGIVTLGALGDSRAYMQRGTSLEQITIDHNLWTLSILDNVAADSALALPHGDALARCLGTFYIEDERLVPIAPQPDIFRFPVTKGDTLLLTTDGLIDFAGANALASEDNILSILLAENNPALASLELILLANRGGGGDNIGIAITRFI